MINFSASLGRISAVIALVGMAPGVLQSQASGAYKLHVDQPQQVIRGLGFEIQSDSIGSGNAGMPEEPTSVPHDLTSEEKLRFYQDMLHGFRYARLAMGLYLRGLDTEKKHIIERFPGQMEDLRMMQDRSGIEGFDVEYWSPAPFWKKNKSYYGGTVGPVTPAFINSFSDALVADMSYLRAHRLRVVQWGLQNEPFIGKEPQQDTTKPPTGDKAQSYATCYYSPPDYTAVLRAAAPKLRAEYPHLEIHVSSWDGPAGPYAEQIRKEPALLANVNAWTWHQVGHNSNDQIDKRLEYMQGAGGKPVYQNEFEYQPWGSRWSPEQYFMNTGQALMNWMVFENSPVWYWIHALKPVTNVEATGYALGFWQPLTAASSQRSLDPQLAPGHWEFNAQNWNAVAGFLKYLGWDSTRLTVDESTVQHDQRIMAWRTKAGLLSIAFSNRGHEPYTFHVSGINATHLAGHRYTLSALDSPLGTRDVESDLTVTVPPNAFEFWVADSYRSARNTK